MSNDKLSEDIQDSLEVDDEPEEVRKYGKKKKNKKFKYFLVFIFFLLISFCVFIALDIFFIDKQMKKDLSTKEKGREDLNFLKIIEIIEKIIEALRKIIENIVLDSIDDEHIKQCIQLNNTIKTLYDNINITLARSQNKSKEELIKELIEETEKTKDLIDCIIDFWETNGYEKCFNPGGGAEGYIYYLRNNFESKGYTSQKINLDTSLNYDQPKRYSPNVPSGNHLYNPSIRNYNRFCPSMGMGLMGSPVHSFM